MTTPSQSSLSLYDNYLACSSHTDESESKPSHAPQGILHWLPFLLQLFYFHAWDPFRMCWLAYLRLCVTCHFFVTVSGDNKPIWMHAEEKEENKVIILDRYFYV